MLIILDLRIQLQYKDLPRIFLMLCMVAKKIYSAILIRQLETKSNSYN